MTHPSHSARYRTDLKQVKAYGSAKMGAHEWLLQRLTALALVPLTFWFITVAMRLFLCTSFPQMISIIASPLNTVLYIFMTTTMLYHGMLGMRVIIEDYVHCRMARAVSLVVVYGVTLFTIIAGFVAIIIAHVTLMGAA